MTQGFLFPEPGSDRNAESEAKPERAPKAGTTSKKRKSPRAPRDAEPEPPAPTPSKSSRATPVLPEATSSDVPAPEREATSPDRSPSDAGARRRAIAEFERPLLLEAGAGTGKTATLVARVVHWCAGPGWDRAAAEEADAEPERIARGVLRGVAAITFTEAAAAEMSGRVSAALLSLQRSGLASPPPGIVAELLPADEELRRRARLLREALDHLNVSTIHAFCRRLLSSYPLAVGLDPAFEVDATFERTTLAVREALESELREAWSEPVDEELVELAVLGVDPPRLEAGLVKLVTDDGARAADFAESPLSPAVCAELVGRFQATAERLGALAAPLHALTTNTHFAYDALGTTRDRFAQLAQAPDDVEGDARARLDAAIELARDVWPSDDKAYDRVKAWAKGRLIKKEESALGEGVADFVDASAAFREALDPLLELEPETLELTRRVTGRLLERVESELRRRGIATFTDLLVDARRLLVDSPGIAARIRRGMRQLLVDEFQDTDAVQCDIVAALALDGPVEERPGLFLVGDPKQSIFAWRNADLRAFDDFRERVEAAGGEVLPLTRNFRSGAAILDEVRRGVQPVMGRVVGVQPEFRDLEPRDDAPDAEVEYWISWPRNEDGSFELDAKKTRGRSYTAEARAVAHDIALRHASGAAWSAHALVLRSFTGVDEYLDELRKRGIPYVVQSDRNYYKRREVVDATALVRAVLDPLDALALVTLLRSPSIGVPDAALLPLWEAELPRKLAWVAREDDERLAEIEGVVRAAARRVPASVPGVAHIAGWEEGLLAMVRLIARLRGSFETLSADAWVDELRRTFLVEGTEAARFLGAYRLANLGRFFRELTRTLEDRAGDVSSLLRTLRANLGREDKSEGSRPADSEEDAVQVLTIHGSKGLEFESVYLCQAHRSSGPVSEDETRLHRRKGRTAYRLFGQAEPGWFASERERARAESAERVRLLYVALTRAARRLVVLGSWPETLRAKPWEGAQTFADLLQHRAGAAEAVTALARRAAEQDETPWVGEDGTTWRLAGFAPEATRGDEAQAPAKSEPELAGVDRIESHGRVLTEQRADARRRMARPFHTRASDGAHLERREEVANGRFGDAESQAQEPGPDDGPGDAPSGAGLGRATAQEVGTEVHRVLEELDVAGDVEAQLEAARGRLAEHFEDDARDRALDLLGRGRPLIERLVALGEDVLAREMPVLLPPPGEGNDDPVGYVAGAVDLLYRDPESGALVVADFKTDFVEGDELEARARGYAAQGAVYTGAVREALGLEEAPRFELWFLHAGRIVVA